jgi:hypothetical protein
MNYFIWQIKTDCIGILHIHIFPRLVKSLLNQKILHHPM